MNDRAAKGRRRDAAELIGTALWFALVTAAFHLGWLLWRRFALNAVISAGIDQAWMVPLSYGLLFLGIGLCGALSLLVRPHRLTRVITIFLLASFSLVSILLMVRQLHPYASLVLGVGVAMRWAAAWRTPLTRTRWMTASTIMLLTVFGVAAVAARLGPRIHESRIERRLAQAPPDAPNVLLIVLDAVRAKNLSLYGYERSTTPELDRWAREGTVFDYAIAPSPWTLPTHGSLFTGLAPTLLSARFTRVLDGKPRRLAETFQQRGYVTAGFSGNNAYGTAEAGLGTGFQSYVSHAAKPHHLWHLAIPFQTAFWKSLISAQTSLGVFRAFRYFNLRTPFLTDEAFLNATDLRGRLTSWLDERPGRPFFVFLNLFDAHEGWAPPDQIRRFAAPSSKNPSARPEPIDRYDAAIRYQDQEIAALLEALRERKLLDRTIVVLTSDHGEQYGEHGLQEHSNSLYMPLLHVPLVIRYPGHVPPGVRVSGAVSLVDLPSTLLSLAGAPAALPGRPLADLWHGAARNEPILSDVERATSLTVAGPTQKGAMRSLVDSKWHYILNGDGAEELYAYRVDPGETKNLAAAPAHAAVMKSMRDALARMPPGYASIDQ